MTKDRDAFGDSALLRTAGVPVKYWLSGANPGIFDKARESLLLKRSYCKSSLHLAQTIGDTIVPAQSLSRDDRRFALAARRTLHKGELLTDPESTRLSHLISTAGPDPMLIQDFRRHCELGREVAEIDTDLDSLIRVEEVRLSRTPAEIARKSPTFRRVVDSHCSSTGLVHSLHAETEQVHDRYVDYLWGRLTRACTDPTPLGWLSHVSLINRRQDRVDSPYCPRVEGWFAADWRMNRRRLRARTCTLNDLDPQSDCRVAINPLRWSEDDLVFAYASGESGIPLVVSVHQTHLLSTIFAALASGPKTYREIAEYFGDEENPSMLAMREVLHHLISIGVLERCISAGISGSPVEFGDIDSNVAAGPVSPAEGWLDVYRPSKVDLARHRNPDLERAVSCALRAASLLTERRPVATGDSYSKSRPWPLTEILRSHVMTPGPLSSGNDSDHTAAQLEPAEHLPPLLNLIAAQADCSTAFTISSSLLDDLGAKQWSWRWPVDCLVRVPTPEAEFTAALDQFWPPATVDSRFVDSLTGLHGPIPHVDAYRSFLRQVEELTGVTFVEFLAPPLSDAAANAVRRPCYTSAWTGDPHSALYFADADKPDRYISLDEITIRRRTDGSLIAEADGAPIWTIYHATRALSEPWATLGEALFAASPRLMPWAFYRFDNLLDELPQSVQLPRITVEGGLVISPAQWRVPRHPLWSPGASVSTKIKALIGFREEKGLPRWIVLSDTVHGTKRACDLESLSAVRMIDRFIRTCPDGKLMEMLPAPTQFPVVDRAEHPTGDAVASEMLLRFPINIGVHVLAENIASDISAYFFPAAS
ncbi:lantibiotic dehydratase [Mycobacterium sp. 141]|uniref:lantibiotic dehydratase n=1 Tax=Mycobacterium sp. 141 TaxID=1120797 RepID=UPI00039EF6D1|nr:lantibiotic dehydratase [Mycobacterium sp. 141]